MRCISVLKYSAGAAAEKSVLKIFAVSAAVEAGLFSRYIYRADEQICAVLKEQCCCLP